MKIRCCGCSNTPWRSENSWAASQRRPDGPRRLPGRAPRRSWSLLGPPEPSRERSWGLPDASQTALGRLSQRLQSDPERLRALESEIFVLFGRFGTDFPRFGRAFRSIVRRSRDPRYHFGFVVDPVARRTSLHVTVTPYALYIDATSSSLASKSV